MKRKEDKAWSAFAKYIDSAKLKKERLETNVERFPDVIMQNRNGAVILIENKHINVWPKRESTAPLHDAFEPGQLPFLTNWRQWEGNAYVLLHVGEGQREILLLPASYMLDRMTTVELHDHAAAQGRKTILIYLENHRK
jgi:hypothetical protein